MKQRLTVRVETLSIGGPNPGTRTWRRREIATVVYQPEAERCETSLQYLEELFELETTIALKEGETNDSVLLDWKPAGISPRTYSTRLSVDNSSKSYIVFNRDGLDISPWRIWTWQIMERFLGKLTFLNRNSGPILAKKIEDVHDGDVGSTPRDKTTVCSKIRQENADQNSNPPHFSPLTPMSYCQPYVQESPEQQEGYRRIEDCPYPPSHDPGKFDRKSPLMRDDSQVRDTCAQSSNQRVGGGGSDAALRAREQGEGSTEASEGDDDGESDPGDDYWKWDSTKRVFWHCDLVTKQVVYCPNSFD